jgi:hypothetical protein
MPDSETVFQWTPKARFKPLDALVVAGALALAYWAWPFLFGASARMAEVWVDGKPKASIHLSGADRDIVLEGRLGPVRLTYGAQGVRVATAPCPNQICVRQGLVHREGARLTCLPSRVVIALPYSASSTRGDGGKAPARPDGVTF